MLGKVTQILRGYSYEQVRTVATVLQDSSINGMEITLNTEDAFEIIRKVSCEFKGKLVVGAGTVLCYEELVKAVAAGAMFVLSPNLMTEKMLSFCKEKGIISVSGALTPSEIAEAFERGSNIVKVFPAKEFSYSYGKTVCEPLGNLKLMAVGGINLSNVNNYLDSGYQYVGTAGGIFKSEDIKNENINNLKKSLEAFEMELGKGQHNIR